MPNERRPNAPIAMGGRNEQVAYFCDIAPNGEPPPPNFCIIQPNRHAYHPCRWGGGWGSDEMKGNFAHNAYQTVFVFCG